MDLAFRIGSGYGIVGAVLLFFGLSYLAAGVI
jgi:hypothetical protein